jgi:N-acyl-D-amino-acid deacylase
MRHLLISFLLGVVPVTAQAADTVLTNGYIHDGTGAPPVTGWLAITGDRISGIGTGAPPAATRTIDVEGQAIAPGFVNMLSWATESLIADGRAQSDIRQGVTLEVMGEGNSMGPLNPEMKRLMAARPSRSPSACCSAGGRLKGFSIASSFNSPVLAWMA